MYKSSKYNHFFELNGTWYVYNILSTGILQLDNSNFLSLKNDSLHNFSDDEIQILTSEGFIVPADCNEENMFRYYFDKSRFSGFAGKFYLCFIPTYNCNLRCPYCYEGREKNPKIISQNEIDSIVKFAEAKIKDSQSFNPIKEIDVQLYGGEPLLCKNEISYFCSEISKLATKYGLSQTYTMVSNLTLLDDQTVEFIRDYDIYVQVSIDGNKENHDKKRIWKSGKGTYDTIIANLEKLVTAGLKNNIIIRLNSDLENLESLCNDFKLFSKYSNDVYFGVLTGYNGLNDCSDACIDTASANMILSEKTSKLYSALNLPIPQRFGKKGPCALNCENKYFVDCYLDVYKCDLLINHKECRVGYICPDGSFSIESNYYNQMAFSPFNSEKCIECKFLPHCAGGCPAEPYLNGEKRDGNLNIYKCTFSDEKLSAILKDYVKNQEI